jgi:glycyl-tRNA synthetase
VTVDFDTLDDDSVTIRNRDTMEQVRVPIENLESAIRDLMNEMRADCQG